MQMLINWNVNVMPVECVVFCCPIRFTNFWSFCFAQGQLFTWQITSCICISNNVTIVRALKDCVGFLLKEQCCRLNKGICTEKTRNVFLTERDFPFQLNNNDCIVLFESLLEIHT